MMIDCISDLHGFYPELEGGDLLLIAGDLTKRDTKNQHLDFWIWVAKQSYKKVCVIGGNHDKYLEEHPEDLKDLLDPNGVICWLKDSGCEFEGLKIWGSPYSKVLPFWNPCVKAFGYLDDMFLEKHWAMIPDDIDILITHTPPYGIMDECFDSNYGTLQHVGSRGLTTQIKRIKPKIHVFGHIHEGHGMIKNRWYPPLDSLEEGKTFYAKDTYYVNAAIMNEYYEPVNKTIRIIL